MVPVGELRLGAVETSDLEPSLGCWVSYLSCWHWDGSRSPRETPMPRLGRAGSGDSLVAAPQGSTTAAVGSHRLVGVHHGAPR